MKIPFDIKGSFEVEIRRKDGLVELLQFSNTVTREAKAYMLRASVVGDVTPTSGWYIGLIGNNIAPSETDTASSALGTLGSYGEVTQYSELNRPSYQSTFKSSLNEINNSDNPASFSITSSVNVYGVFITNTASKNSNSGVLLCAGRFSTAKAFSDGDLVVVRYSIRTTSS